MYFLIIPFVDHIIGHVMITENLNFVA